MTWPQSLWCIRGHTCVNNSLLVFLWCSLAGGMRFIGVIVDTVIFVSSWPQDDAQHCPVHVFVSGTISRISTEAWQAQFGMCLGECMSLHTCSMRCENLSSVKTSLELGDG